MQTNPRSVWTRMTTLCICLVVAVALAGPVQAQQTTWRGLDVPHYPHATNVHVETDHDEYDAYFNSSDSVGAIFDFYKAWLEKQGFHATRSKQKSKGFKAHMVRGSGGSGDRVELDAKRDHGRYKVEIEFDD